MNDKCDIPSKERAEFSDGYLKFGTIEGFRISDPTVLTIRDRGEGQKLLLSIDEARALRLWLGLVLPAKKRHDETSGEPADVARFRWLTADIADHFERGHRNGILEGMAVMSYSAVCASIDAAMIEFRSLLMSPAQHTEWAAAQRSVPYPGIAAQIEHAKRYSAETPDFLRVSKETAAAPKRAYYETHEPPHCPTCECAIEKAAGER